MIRQQTSQKRIFKIKILPVYQIRIITLYRHIQDFRRIIFQIIIFNNRIIYIIDYGISSTSSHTYSGLRCRPTESTRITGNRTIYKIKHASVFTIIHHNSTSKRCGMVTVKSRIDKRQITCRSGCFIIYINSTTMFCNGIIQKCTTFKISSGLFSRIIQKCKHASVFCGIIFEYRFFNSKHKISLHEKYASQTRCRIILKKTFFEQNIFTC